MRSYSGAEVDERRWDRSLPSDPARTGPWGDVVDVDLVRAEVDGEDLLVWSTEGGEVVLTRLRPPAPELRLTAAQARRLIGALAGLRGVRGDDR